PGVVRDAVLAADESETRKTTWSFYVTYLLWSRCLRFSRPSRSGIWLERSKSVASFWVALPGHCWSASSLDSLASTSIVALRQYSLPCSFTRSDSKVGLS